jgi:hypothetical protein
MLGATYRIHCENKTGVAFGATDTITIKTKRFNFSSTGQRTAESAEATITPANFGNSLASNGTISGSTQDNTAASTFWLGGEIKFTVALTTATPNGNVNFYMQVSTDGGTTWPDASTGELIASIKFTATGTQNQAIEY